MLFSVKPVIFIIGFTFNILYILIFYFDRSKLFKILFCSFLVILFCVLYFNFIEELNFFTNKRRVIEATYDLNKINPEYIDFGNVYSVLGIIGFAFKNFYLNPNFFNSENLFQFIQSIENLAMIAILIFNLFYCYNLDKEKTIFWLIYLIIGTITIGGVVFNFGTMSRWKMEIIMYYIFYLNFTCQIKKK